MTVTKPWLLEPEVRRVQRRVVAVLSGAQVLGSIALGASFSVGILLAEEVTGSEGWAGVARTSTTVGAAVVALPLAMLAVRRGRRTALAGGWTAALVGALALIAAGSLGSTPLLVAGMLLFGVGSAVGLQSRFAATDLAPPSSRGRTLSLVVWAGTAGSVVGPNLGTPGLAVERLLGMAPLTGAFAIAAVALGLVVALLLIGLRPDPGLLAAASGHEPGVAPAPVAPAASWWDSLVGGVRTIWGTAASRQAFVALVLAHAAMVLLMTMTPVHMSHHGLGLEIVGLVISGHVLGMFAFSPVVGWLADTVGRGWTIGAGQVVLLASAVLAIGWSATTAGISASLFLLGLGWSLVLIPAATVVSESAPPSSRTLVQGASDTVMNLVAALAAGLSGVLLGVIGFANLGWGVVAAVMVVAVGYLHGARRRGPDLR